MQNNAQTTKTSLVLNFAPIDFDNQQIQVGIITYQNKEQLQLLRKQYASTHLFYRDRSIIFVVPVVPNVRPFGEMLEAVWLNDHLDLCIALMRDSLTNKLFNMNRQIIKLDPLRFVAAGANDDLLAVAVSKYPDINAAEWLVAPIVYDINIRRVYFDTATPLPGLALKVRSTRLINKPCDELLAGGLTLNGLYVGRKMEAEDRREAPHLQILGRVKSVQAGQLLLDDSRTGIENVAASEVFIEGRSDIFNLCVDHVFKNNSPRVKAELENQLAALRDGPGKLTRLETVIQSLSRMRLEIVPGIPFSIQTFIDEEDGDTFPETKDTPKPVFVFNPAGDRTNTWNDGGLTRFGPYTTHSFTPTRPNIAVICQSRLKGRVEQFLYRFFNGLEIKDGKFEYFPSGFIGKYRLDGYTIEFFQTESNSPQAYRKAARQVIEHQTDRNFKWDLVMIQTEDDFRELRGDANPYLVTKATFLQNQIPTQAFEIENAELEGKQSVYVLNTMALATYAKLGGVPWMLKANPTVNHELVIGLGSAEVGDGRFGDRQKYVGMTTVFSSDGAYWLSNLSRAVVVSDYKDELLQSLRKTIRRISQDMNWQKGDNVRLVFHVFNSVRDKEVEAVKTLMSEFSLYKAEYAFLQIVEDHPFILFDRQQASGVYDPQLRISGKGKLVPRRGLYFHLSRYETLLTLTGPENVKRPEDGIPQPLLLRLHRNSTFYDMTYLARQTFTFSAHSWRTFFTVSLPVTILYSDLVARLLGELNEVSGWNSDVLLNRIGRTRWFL